MKLPVLILVVAVAVQAVAEHVPVVKMPVLIPVVAVAVAEVGSA